MSGTQDSRPARLALALDPAACPVDGRGSRERLAFAAAFGKLIQYYDQSNRVAGNWEAFFLKDPAILLAAISSTDYRQMNAQFDALSPPPALKDDCPTLAWAINGVCQLLRRMFGLLNHWLYFMDRGGPSTSLRDFLKQKVVGDLARQWHLLDAWQQQLCLLPEGGIAAADPHSAAALEPVWRHTGSAAFALPDGWFDGMDLPDRLQAGLTALRAIYDPVFDVLMQTAEHARPLFYEQEQQATPYPDTALLIAFSRLMELQQAQLNQLGSKHLDFYYDRVLQQAPRPAQADEVLVFLSLSAAAPPMTLPAGTPFSAGSNPDKSEIVFASVADSQIDHATIAAAWTLYRDSKGLYLTQIDNPAKAVLNAHQEARQWDAFGNAQGTPCQQGFALASPMLLLQGGTRTITVTLDVQWPDMLAGASYFLSTAADWLPVSSIPVDASTVQFVLQPDAPPIVAFDKVMDGYTSKWPLLKVMLGPVANVVEPGFLQSVSIDVQVDSLTQFTTANDTSILPANGPARIFGPLPELGGNFYVGSNECFAKPLTTLTLTIDWDNVPPDLALYYAQYNSYLASLRGDFEPTFDNLAFQVEWKLLNSSSWSSLPPVEAVESGVSLFQKGDKKLNAQSSTFLFLEFGTGYTPMPELVLAPLPPIGPANNGYLRMQLKAPHRYAFGHAMYARLVSHISLQNALALMRMRPDDDDTSQVRQGDSGKARWRTAWNNRIRKWLRRPEPAPGAIAQCIPKLQDMPNLPYTPRCLSVAGSYHAFSGPVYPVALYHYGAFQTSLVDAAAEGDTVSDAMPSLQAQQGQGVLYIQLSALRTPCTLSLYLEVIPDTIAAADTQRDVVYSCWNAGGWQPVVLLLDETDQLRRSGVVKLALVGPYPDCPSMPPGAPGTTGNLWLALSTGPQCPPVKLGYINTQAVKLRRTSLAPQPTGQTPQIAANTIASPRNKMAQITRVAQPLASFGGMSAENRETYGGPDSFYRRVSTRLAHKDRCSSQSNYVAMAHELCPDLYYAALVPANAGTISIGLVQKYASPQLPNAYRPVVPGADLSALQQQLARRVSAMATVSVRSFGHQLATVRAHLTVAPQANLPALKTELNQRLRIYLSPWITSDMPQMDVRRGIRQSDVIAVLRANPQVLAVRSLEIDVARWNGVAQSIRREGLIAPAPGALFVSAMEHGITLDYPGDAVARQGDGREVLHG